MTTLSKAINIQFKDGHASFSELLTVEPILNHIFFYFCHYAKEYHLPIRVTSIRGDAIGRKSTTHKEGRAIDISTRGWDVLHCNRIASKLNMKFSKNIGTSPVGGTERVCVYGDEQHLDHFHLQVKRNVKLFS